ncbi:hypothetical protein B0H63DRAFT_471960 [Podospora didyma]|uniref:Ecp2 effector protein domain-containing protein n=1 Tax=Podospora didyma TaxID=330526 RepID=A0AAE0NP66_9PEZI|nr:hypothetical protein B0H63DRAFT_471960 [Podospora didyma]
MVNMKPTIIAIGLLVMSQVVMAQTGTPDGVSIMDVMRKNANGTGELTEDEVVALVNRRLMRRRSISLSKRLPANGTASECDSLNPGEARAYASDAVRCLYFLSLLKDANGEIGKASCAVPEGKDATVFCYVGKAQVQGVSVLPKGTSSTCSDVAIGAGKVFDDCFDGPTGSVQGNHYSNDNGDMLVGIRSWEGKKAIYKFKEALPYLNKEQPKKG